MKRPKCPDCGAAMKKDGKAGSGRVRWYCCSGRTTSPEKHVAGYDKSAAKRRAEELKAKVKRGVNTFIITSAQNNTALNGPFFRALKQACKCYNAELVAVPVHYKNISLYTASQEYKKKWAKEIEPFLIDENIDLGGNVRLMAGIRVQATSAHPLQGKQPIGGRRWTIYGHPQVAMEPVASPATRHPKHMYTTGAVTRPNYSQSDQGAKAEFHHVTGALIVEIYKGKAFVRQLNADSNGNFYDLDKRFTPDGWTGGHDVLALTPGDGHEIFMSKACRHALYEGEDSITKALNPEWIFHHDLLDGYAGSHHHENDPITQYKKFHSGMGDYRKEIDRVVNFLNKHTPNKCAIVPSNHHDHLTKFLNRADANKDHLNAHFILEMQKAMREAVDKGEDCDPFRLYLEPRLKVKCKFLDRNTPFLLQGVDYSQHFDVGTNGSRGSAAALAKTTYKMVGGHAHSARIKYGVFQVGKSTGRLEYERGLSDHSNTHCLQYRNGKRTLITQRGKLWRMPR